MKKFLSLILCAAAVLSLAACGCAGAAVQSPQGSGTAPTGGLSVGSAVYTMDETVIAEGGGYSFAVTSVDPEGEYGFTVSARCENRSDRPLMFSWTECSVNGWMIDPFWAQEVTPGNTANARITFDRNELARCGITTVDEIEFELNIYDSDNWAADSLVSEDYAIYPTGKSPAQVTAPQRVPKDTETPYLDNDRCVFIVESVEPDGVMGYTLVCYLENRTDDSLMFTWDDVAVNATMVDPLWAEEVEAGKRAYSEISFFRSDFEANGIDTVDQIEFRLRVYDSDDYDPDDLIADEVLVFVP